MRFTTNVLKEPIFQQKRKQKTALILSLNFQIQIQTKHLILKK